MDIATISLATKALALFLMSVLPVSIKTNSGETIDATLTGFTDSAIQIDTAGQSREISFDDLLSLAPTAIKPGTGPTYRIILAGGSRIAAQGVSLDGSELFVEPRRQPELRIPVREVKAIRFRPANSATDPQWLGLVGQENRGDQLVIRRGEDRLDPQSGVVEGISGGKVGFDLDGDKVDAPIERLEGVVFGATSSDSKTPNIQIVDVYGSQWLVDSIEPSPTGEPLKIRISESLVHSLPLDHIKSIRWSGGLLLLAQQDPASNTTAPYFQTKLNQELVEKFFSATADGAEDLVAHGGSSIEYRIDDGYQTFSGLVHRLGSVTDGSGMKAVIQLDGETVWEQELVGDEPRGFELPIGESRRVAIIIDNGSDGDLGDTVRIVRPRLTK